MLKLLGLWDLPDPALLFYRKCNTVLIKKLELIYCISS